MEKAIIYIKDLENEFKEVGINVLTSKEQASEMGKKVDGRLFAIPPDGWFGKM